MLSLEEDVNILVLDTEMYSNTGLFLFNLVLLIDLEVFEEDLEDEKRFIGGEMSKATPMGAVVKYATSGKQKLKKDLGMHAMLYGNVYVGSIAMGASYAQTVQALKEAESYNGKA